MPARISVPPASRRCGTSPGAGPSSPARSCNTGIQGHRSTPALMTRGLGSFLMACVAVGVGAAAAAQQRASEFGTVLLQVPAVRAAVDAARAVEPQTIEDQIRLCEVEAPPFQEAARAQVFAQLLRDAGAK